GSGYTPAVKGPKGSWVVFAAVAAVTFAVFLPSLASSFVRWDDEQNFLDNPAYRGLGPANLAWMFTHFHLGHYQPLPWITLGLDYVIWGMNPVGYHLTNVVLHALSAGVFAWLAAWFFGRAGAVLAPLEPAPG